MSMAQDLQNSVGAEFDFNCIIVLKAELICSQAPIGALDDCHKYAVTYGKFTVQVVSSLLPLLIYGKFFPNSRALKGKKTQTLTISVKGMTHFVLCLQFMLYLVVDA